MSLYRRPVDKCENVEHRGDVWVITATCWLLEVVDGLLTQRHGHLIATLRRVLDHEVVQSSKSHWDFRPGCSLAERTRPRRA